MPQSSSHLTQDDSHSREGEFRILIVKWDLLYGDAIRRIVQDVFPSAQITLCRSGGDALDVLRRSPMALGLFGLTLPDFDGLDLLAIVANERLVRRMMVVSGRRDERSRQALRVAHVDGVFDTFSEDATALAAAVRCVGGGGCYFSPTWREEIPCMRATAARMKEVLSMTELQVFSTIGDGSDDEAAAERLGMGVQTVHTHRRNIMRKLGISSRTELMKEAIRRGIVRIAHDHTIRPGFDLLLRRDAGHGRNLPSGGEEHGAGKS